MTFEAKLTMLAPLSAALQAYFGVPPEPFRLFDRQQAQMYIRKGPCLTFRRVTTVSMYSQYGLLPMEQPLVQFDVRVSPQYTDNATSVARAAKDAVIAWLGTVSFAENNQFASPATTPPHFPCFVVNRRATMEPQSDPPVYVEQIDVRIYNTES